MANQKLLVEGKDDKHVLYALCQEYNIKENFDIIDCDGIDKLKESISVRFKSSGVHTIGIIIDADTQINNRWHSIKNILHSLDWEVPDEIPVSGLILNNNNKTFGLWIMPDNKTNGILEDFIALLIPSHDDLIPIVNCTLDKIETENKNRYPLIHRPKAMIHTWLALQETPGSPMGSSITKRYLVTEHIVCKSLVDWLNNLFQE